MKFAKLLRAPILKNIWKRLLLEVFHKKVVLKNFAIFTETKVASDKCSVKKIYQYVNTIWLLLTENTCVGVSFNSENCEIFQSTYFEEHLQTAASENVFIKIIHKEI